MKEKIYTIPVMDAFNTDCECPLCILEKKLEDEYVEYFLGASLMEPDWRKVTNEKGFCRNHFELLYNSQLNRLGLGLIIDTHMLQHNKRLKEIYYNKVGQVRNDSHKRLALNLSSKVGLKTTETSKLTDELVNHLSALEKSCTICDRIYSTIDRYIDVILYLWVNESDFKELFSKKKGFCLKHLKLLLEGTKKYMKPGDAALFIPALMDLQFENLERTQQEVNWFTKKFDYKNNDAPWGNSRDAIPRGIQRLAGPCCLK
jgi:hypothetical protein